MRNPNPVGAGEGRSAMTPVTSDCGFSVLLWPSDSLSGAR
jgi:hypothetical protein